MVIIYSLIDNIILLFIYLYISYINIHKLESFIIACDSFGDNIMKLDNTDVNHEFSSIILEIENAKLSNNIDCIIELLLQNITDKYLSLSNIPISYRLSLSRSFQLPYSKQAPIENGA